jgi:hypothetical protein
MTEVREPSSVIEIAEMVGYYYTHSDPSKIREERIRDLFMCVPQVLKSTDFYELDLDFINAARGVVWNMAHGMASTDFRFDSDCRLPSKVCGFWAPGMHLTVDGGLKLPALYLAYETEESWFDFIVVSPYAAPVLLGGYNSKTGGPIHMRDGLLLEDEKERYHQVLLIGGICSLINQPGFVATEPAGSRQQRRAAQRSGGYSPTAWHKISWNVGEAVKAKLTRDEPTRCMPLHYTRGHWRKAEEGWNNVERRKDGLWYQWIEGYWSGHPAFGIKRSYHAPKLARAG